MYITVEYGVLVWLSGPHVYKLKATIRTIIRCINLCWLHCATLLHVISEDTIVFFVNTERQFKTESSYPQRYG